MSALEDQGGRHVSWATGWRPIAPPRPCTSCSKPAGLVDRQGRAWHPRCYMATNPPAPREEGHGLV